MTEAVLPAQLVIGGVSSTPPRRRTRPNAAERVHPTAPGSDGSSDGGSRPQQAAEPPERPTGGRQISGRDPSGEGDSAGSRAPPHAAEGERRTGRRLLGGGFGEVPASPFPWTERERCSLRHRPCERSTGPSHLGLPRGPVRQGWRPADCAASPRSSTPPVRNASTARCDPTGWRQGRQEPEPRPLAYGGRCPRSRLLDARPLQPPPAVSLQNGDAGVPVPQPRLRLRLRRKRSPTACLSRRLIKPDGGTRVERAPPRTPAGTPHDLPRTEQSGRYSCGESEAGTQLVRSAPSWCPRCVHHAAPAGTEDGGTRRPHTSLVANHRAEMRQRRATTRQSSPPPVSRGTCPRSHVPQLRPTNGNGSARAARHDPRASRVVRPPPPRRPACGRPTHPVRGDLEPGSDGASRWGDRSQPARKQRPARGLTVREREPPSRSEQGTLGGHTHAARQPAR